MKRPGKKKAAKRSRTSRRAISYRRETGLRAKETQEIVLAIRRGKIDALVTDGANGEQVLMLQGADHPYRVLVETINDGVATLDATGNILYANSRFGAILRIPVENFVGTPLHGHFLGIDQEVLRNLITEGLLDSTQGEITLGEMEGRRRLVRLTLNPVLNSDPQTVCVIATELTELAEANEALRANEESLRALSGRLLKLQDEERRRIARDLHDITGQKLAVQSMALSELLNSKSTGLDAETRRALSDCDTLNKQVGEEIRTLSYLLHPPLLDELGLPSAVKWYAEGFERRTGIRIKVDVDADLQRLPPDVEMTLFRIIQESLTNVHRYSGSATASVEVKLTDDQIEVKIRDQGRGIHRNILNAATGRVAPLGVGIQGMKERLRQLDGKLEITSQSNKGTLVIATLPLSKSASTASPSASNIVGFSPRGGALEAPVRERNDLKKQILIADDHEMMRCGLRTMLEKETEWEICGEATNGQEAVDKTTSLRPDLVILDINMPVLNGLAEVRQILRNRPETKILMFTVHDSDQTQKEIQAAGAHAFISKSNGSGDLLRMVKELI